MKKILFGMKYMNITQSRYTDFSHSGVNAYDLAGKDTGIDPFYCWDKSGAEVIDSFKNGIALYFKSADFTALFYHKNSTIENGRVFKYGDIVYTEGTYGNATGNHIHLELIKGKTKPNFNNPTQSWSYRGSDFDGKRLDIEDAFFVDKTIKIVDKKGLNFEKVEDLGDYDAIGISKNEYGQPVYIKYREKNGDYTANYLDSSERKANGINYIPENYGAYMNKVDQIMYRDKSRKNPHKNSDGSNKVFKKDDILICDWRRNGDVYRK